MEKFKNNPESIDEMARRGQYYGSNESTKELIDSFNNSAQGMDLKAIGVQIEAIDTRTILLTRKGGPMSDVELYKNEAGEFCYEYLSSKEGVERYALHKFETPDSCLRSLLLRIIRNNIPAAIIPKKDIPNINFSELVPVGGALSMQDILLRMKQTIAADELIDPDADAVEALPTIRNLENMGIVGKTTQSGTSVDIIKKVDIISPKYKFYSRAASRVGEIYGEMISQILDVDYSEIAGTIKGSSEVWRVNNTNRLPLNSINFRTGDNSVRCNIQDNEIFGSVFIAIFKRTFKRAKGKYEKEHLIIPGYSFLRSASGTNKNELLVELNELLSDYFLEAAEKLEPTIFIDPGMEGSLVHENAKALLIKYLLKKGSMDLKREIGENDKLSDLVDMTTKHEDMDELTRKLIDVSRALRFV
jgi:hypothetical protein